MAEERVRRRLAAILAADVVGYSRLVEQDEAGTLAALTAWRKEVLEPLVAKNHGRIFKLMGDGVLIEFGSPVEAVRCAVELQEGMAAANTDTPKDRHIILRIGVNLGDVVVEGGDCYGDGVNIAARLEGLAKPGDVVVSGTTYDHVRNKVERGFDDLGVQTLKNIAEPVRTYRVAGMPRTPIAAQTDKPAVAVLPFVNMSGDPEQEYFSDGITEDIITDLSKVSALNVLSRSTTLTFKGKAVDVGQIASQLKVSHFVEGSVRKAGGRVRITAQLIETRKDRHVWAERYDRDLKDIFALQDEISHAIVTALKGKLLPAEKKAIEARSTHDPEAYKLYLLGRHYQRRRGARDLEIAIRFCSRALDIDPDYARAWALVALCQAVLHLYRKSEETGLSAAEKALTLDPTLAEAHAAKGRALAELGRGDEALAAHEVSLRSEPDSYDVEHNFGRTCLGLGLYEAAIKHLERASHLLDEDFASPGYVAQSYRSLGRHDEAAAADRRALERIEREITLRPDNAYAMMRGAITLAYLGEKERAKEWASRALIIEPDDPINHYNIACAFAQMNEPERAVELLESCLHKMSAGFILWVKRDGDLMSLHGNRRFHALIASGEASLGNAASQAGGSH
jgi:adenylate cyclase